MATANSGNTVRLEYTGKLDDGTVFDSSDHHGPLSITLGDGKVIPGFETALIGMEVGETKTQRLSAEEAYGPRDDSLLFSVEKSQLPDDLNPTVGESLEVSREDGVSFPVQIAEVAEETITLDANHPLAGQALTFEIKLLEIL